MIDKNYYELCKVSYVTTDKPTIIDAIHRYLNMFPQLMPLSKTIRDRRLAKALEENNFTLLQSNYFTTSELKYAWDKAYFIVLDNNSQKKTVLIQSGEKFSRISTRYAIQTIRHIHKLIVKDVHHQSFYLKCTKNIGFFIDKMKSMKEFIKEGDDRFVKTTNIIFNPGDTIYTNCSFVHQYVVVKYNSLYKEWNYENTQKVIHGLPSIASYIKEYIMKLSIKEKFSSEQIISIIEEKNKKAIEDIQKNVTKMAYVISN